MCICVHLWLILPAVAAGGPPTYDRDVAPIMRQYCMPCHDARSRTAGLELESHAGLMKGGRQGPAIVPGKSGESLLVLLVEGKKPPKMPPAGPGPTKAEIDRLKAWIDAGAGSGAALRGTRRPAPGARDSGATVAGSPEPRPRVPVSAQVAALAFSPDGKVLAAGGYREVWLRDARRLTPLGRLAGPSGTVTAVAFSPDGKFLAAAGGAPGQFGEICIWPTPAIPPSPPRKGGANAPLSSQGGGDGGGRPTLLRGHRDAIYSLAFSPDGKTLAAGSYDRTLSLWRAPFRPGAAPRMLKDHTDAVFGVAFSPDGKRIASVSGDRTVKVWDAASGKRVFTLSEATAELYSVAFHPSGRALAAGGVDKSLRVWSLTGTGGALQRSSFAHEGPVLQVRYSPDGSRIVTSGEDRRIKLWHAGTLAETRVLERQSDWPLAVAISPDGRLLASGRYDGRLALYDAGSGRRLAISEASPKTSGTPASRAARPASATPARPAGDGKPTRVPAALRGTLSPLGAARGERVTFTLRGVNISDATRVRFDDPAITGRVLRGSIPALKRNEVRVEAEIGPTARIGVHRLFLQTPMGTTGSLPFAVGGWPEHAAPEDMATAPMPLTFPVTVTGTLARAGDEHAFSFEARAGQELVFQVVAAAVGSRLNGALSLHDDGGRRLAQVIDVGPSLDPVLGYRFERAGRYTLRLRDYEGAGGGDVSYRLNAGEFPYVTGAFPLGVRRGETRAIALQGYNLGPEPRVTVAGPAAPRDAPAWGQTIAAPVQTPLGTPLNEVRLAVTEEPERLEIETEGRGARNDTPETAEPVSWPVTIDGRIAGSAAGRPDADCFRFRARKGEPLVLEVAAQRLGSPLDSFLEVLDAQGRPVPRATLRCEAETALVLSDRDANSAGFRIQSWVDLGVNDLVFAGRELLRVARLPNGPDDDIVFQTVRGRRIGLLDTTPQHHSVGSPVYKVTLHPPDAGLSPNGMPIFRLNTQNDDGGPLYGKDSRITFDPPADGEYVVRLTDAQGREGADFAYRLTIRPPHPDFRLTMSPEHPNVPRGGAVPVEVTAERLDGFGGPIAVEIAGLPPGVSASPAVIPPNMASATVTLTAAEDPPTLPADAPATLRVTGRAEIGGRVVTRAVSPEGHHLALLPAPDVTVRTDRREVTIRPGEEVDVTALIARHHGFGGRVPIEVRNLPFGVRVLDVGLNGVLVTEQETSRRFVLLAEPWVTATERPFYAVARVESDPASLVASPPILLRVLPRSAPPGAAASRAGR